MHCKIYMENGFSVHSCAMCTIVSMCTFRPPRFCICAVYPSIGKLKFVSTFIRNSSQLHVYTFYFIFPLFMCCRQHANFYFPFQICNSFLFSYSCSWFKGFEISSLFDLVKWTLGWKKNPISCAKRLPIYFCKTISNSKCTWFFVYFACDFFTTLSNA